MLPMKDLAAMFEKAGCADVRTYIQSGNVIFRADADVAARIPDVIAKGIAARSKIKIPVVVRTAADLRRVAEKNPFLRRGVDVDKLHVVFLAAKPASAALSALDPKRSPPTSSPPRGAKSFSTARTAMAAASSRTPISTPSLPRRARSETGARSSSFSSFAGGDPFALPRACRHFGGLAREMARG